MGTGPRVTYRELSLGILEAESLDKKLSLPSTPLSDDEPGPALRLPGPARSRQLRIRPATVARVPAVGAMADPNQRPRLLHACANHELQAVELFAWALLAFPEDPADLRSGLVRVLIEEQDHVRLYLSRLAHFGVALGDFPVSGYFWGKVPDFTTPLQFICAMSLTFENANLDHSLDLAQAARAAEDEQTALLFDRIYADEIGHVRFGWYWLERLKQPEQSMWQAYCQNVTWPLRGALARGTTFHPEGREAVGMDPEFIRLLSESDRDVDPR